MNTQHIPGPWTAYAPSEDLETRHWTIRAPGSGPMVSFEVARVSGRSVADRHTACLIAAAPDLLAALNAAKQLFDVALPKFNWAASALDADAIRILNEAPIAVNAAIAKATGVAA